MQSTELERQPWSQWPKTIKDTVKSFFQSTGRAPWDFSDLKLPPESVRLAINSGSGYIDPKTLRSLINSSRWEPVGFYLAIRSVNDPDLQREALQSAFETELGEESYAKSLREIANKLTESLSPDTQIKANKLPEINRIGVDTWEDRFRDRLRTITQLFPEHDVLVQAWATLSGVDALRDFLRVHPDGFKLLVPKWYKDPENPNCGFEVLPGRVSILDRNFSRRPNFITLDDTTKTGDSMREMWGFLKGHHPDEVEVDSKKALFINNSSRDGVNF